MSAPTPAEEKDLLINTDLSFNRFNDHTLSSCLPLRPTKSSYWTLSMQCSMTSVRPAFQAKSPTRL